MSAADYDAAAGTSRSARHALASSEATAVWDAQLAPAIAEEAVADSFGRFVAGLSA